MTPRLGEYLRQLGVVQSASDAGKLQSLDRWSSAAHLHVLPTRCVASCTNTALRSPIGVRLISYARSVSGSGTGRSTAARHRKVHGSMKATGDTGRRECTCLFHGKSH